MYDNGRVLEIIGKLGPILRASVLACDLPLLDSLRYDLLLVRVDWAELLAEKKSQYLHPKDKDLTELDRRVMLNASLANIERDYDFLIGLERLVEQRIELWRSYAADAR